MVFRFPTVIFFPFFLPQPLAPVQHTKPHTHTPMIHWSTYPNQSPHTEPHTHTNTNHQTFNRATHTQTIKPVGANNGDHTHHPSHRSTNPSNRSETHAADLKPRLSKIPRKTSKIPKPPIRNPRHRFSKISRKMPMINPKKIENTQAIDQKPRPSKIPSKTKTKPKLKQHHQSKPIQKKSLLEPPSELLMINPTDPPTNQQIHCFKPTNQPIQTHHQPNPAHDPNPARWSKLDPTSKIQNPRLVRDKERKWESKWERERIKYCF